MLQKLVTLCCLSIIIVGCGGGNKPLDSDNAASDSTDISGSSSSTSETAVIPTPSSDNTPTSNVESNTKKLGGSDVAE